MRSEAASRVLSLENVRSELPAARFHTTVSGSAIYIFLDSSSPDVGR
jgi:hypothetical protein